MPSSPLCLPCHGRTDPAREHHWTGIGDGTEKRGDPGVIPESLDELSVGDAAVAVFILQETFGRSGDVNQEGPEYCTARHGG
jgi:hypothetical protein